MTETDMRIMDLMAGLALVATALFWTSFGARADILYDTGPATQNGGLCDQTTSGDGCGGGGSWTIYGSFVLSSNSTVGGFTYNTYNSRGSMATDYTGTTWSIWNDNPFFNHASVPIDSGTTTGSLSAGAAGSILVTVGGLDIDLAAGTYWLGTTNDEDVSTDITAFASTSTPNVADTASQSDCCGDFPNAPLDGPAFTIESPTVVTVPPSVPEPSSLAILIAALTGLGVTLARRHQVRFSTR